mgnify:CR=1 FL=1
MTSYELLVDQKIHVQILLGNPKQHVLRRHCIVSGFIGGNPLYKLFFGDDHPAADVQYRESWFVHQFIGTGW